MSLLQLMSDGRFHSGTALGAALGVSRTAVWKQIQRWQQKGMRIDVVPGKGYRWCNPIEWWSEDKLRAHLSPEASRVLSAIQIVNSVGSTNAVIYDALSAGAPLGVVCLAEEQTAGKGRRGRDWVAPLGRGFYGSIGWVFSDGIAVLEGLSLAVGLAVATALKSYGVDHVGLKWPNDIMIGTAKMGGILIEMQLDGDGCCRVVIGIGVNFDMPFEMSQTLGREITDVVSHSEIRALERNRLGGMILDAVVRLLSNYGAGRFEALREAWCELDLLRDAQVEVLGGADELVGMARGVDAHGALLLETPSGIMRISSGEVSLRKR